MSKNEIELLPRTKGDRIQWALEQVERANLYSRQDRFKTKYSGGDLFSSMLSWTKTEQYPYVPDSRARDSWLSKFWKNEPHISGVVNQVVAIDKNRGWSLTGPQRQVTLYNNILRQAEDDEGWRAFMSMTALDYYTSDLGAITELGRQGKNGPLRGVYHMDPTQCRLTGDRLVPLAVNADKGEQKWTPGDFFRISSLPSSQQKYHRLGFCALSRAINLVNLLMAVYTYDQEQLGARAPKGLLLLQNISEAQWDDAMKVRDTKLDSLEQEYFGGVAVLAQEGMDQIDAKLVALSQLPQGFDRKIVTDQIMFGFALIFGYSADEFWPVQFGALGRSRETEIHHLRASAKGGSDFVLGFQDHLQQEMPASLLFEFDARDYQAQATEAEMYDIWARVAKTLYEGGLGVLDQEQVRELLVEKGLIPPDFTATVEPESITSSDGISRSLRRLRERLEYSDQIRRAAEIFPTEPIVQYCWPTHRVIRVWDRAEDIFARRIYQGVDLLDQ